MIKKKICLIGSFSVGKTSLVERHVHSIFSNRYHTTVGVKIDRKEMQIGDRRVDLILWDLNGEDEFQPLSLSYLRGSSGLLYVIDGTRRATLETTLSLVCRARDAVGDLPAVVALNKSDLDQEWEITDHEIERIAEFKLPILRTSAKTGQGVEQVFRTLAEATLVDP